MLAERRLRIARQEQTQSVSGASSAKNSPKKASGDVLDGPSEIAACNLLAPPATYYNSSRTGIDGLTTSVSKIQQNKNLQFNSIHLNGLTLIFFFLLRRVDPESVALSKRKTTMKMMTVTGMIVH